MLKAELETLERGVTRLEGMLKEVVDALEKNDWEIQKAVTERLALRAKKSELWQMWKDASTKLDEELKKVDAEKETRK